MADRLLISFSGGRTSAYMTLRLLEHIELLYSDWAVVFANTGREHPATLDFVRRCDDHFGFNVVWVEAEVHEGRVACTHRVVDPSEASVDGEPFERVIAKYGIPNKSYPHCTRELKLNPIHSYVKSLGWEDYETAIGIRADEQRRVAKSSPYNIVYPLAHWWPTDKAGVNDFWAQQSFNLDIPEHLGNCVACWKKSLKKLTMVAHERPFEFEWTARMEREYGHIGRWDDRVFFRENMSTKQLLDTAGLVNIEYLRRQPDRPDEDGGCSESCEIYPMESVNVQ